MIGGIVYLKQEIPGDIGFRNVAYWSDDGTLTGNLSLTQVSTNGAPSVAQAPDALAGTMGASGVAGPFAPALSRPINLRLSGTWVGTVALKRSIDGGTTKDALTVGGDVWGVFTANCNEPVWEESEVGATYYLEFARTSGTLVYRVAQ